MAKARRGSTGERPPDRIMLSRTLILLVVCGIAAFMVLVSRLYQGAFGFSEERRVKSEEKKSTPIPWNWSCYLMAAELCSPAVALIIRAADVQFLAFQLCGL